MYKLASSQQVFHPLFTENVTNESWCIRHVLPVQHSREVLRYNCLIVIPIYSCWYGNPTTTSDVFCFIVVYRYTKHVTYHAALLVLFSSPYTACQPVQYSPSTGSNTTCTLMIPNCTLNFLATGLLMQKTRLIVSEIAWRTWNGGWQTISYCWMNQRQRLAFNVPSRKVTPAMTIGVRDGGSGGAVDPPIRADIWHLFGQKTTHLFD